MAPKKKSQKTEETPAAETAAGEEKPAAEEKPTAEEKPAAEAKPAAEEPAEPPKADKQEEEPEPEEPKELEEDAKDDKRKKLDASAAAWNMADSTLNVLPAFGGKLLTTLTDSGFSHLLAGIRATVGVKSGRYMFETTALEQGAAQQPSQPQGRTSKHVVRVGLSLAGSSLFLSDTEDHVFFDNEGFFNFGKGRTRTGQKFPRGSTVAVLVNLDATSPNANTVSVFVNGVRSCEPQKLPEAWKGKVLYPTATFKNVTLHANFGPTAEKKLPFACRMLSDAAKADVEVAQATAGGTPEVLLPVGLPDQGIFDWADDFLAKNPSYTELSARKMLDWAVKSGLPRKGPKSSNDHPEMGFGVPAIDDLSVVAMAKAIAPFHKRNYLVMELKSNLMVASRGKTLAQFPDFKKRAAVMMGEPSQDFKKAVQAIILDGKAKAREAEKKRKAAEAERKKAAEERQKKLEAAKKARLAGKKDGEEKADEPTEKVEEKAAEEPEEPLTLTDEEKATVFRKLEAPDLSAAVLSKFFGDFSIPAASEGFDAVDFLWQNEAGCKTHLQEFVLQRKLTSRVETLKPGEWFTKANKEFQALLAGWKKRQSEWKNPGQKKALLAKLAAEKKAAKAEKGDEADKDEDAEPMKIDAEDIDVFSVEDVMDIGSGEPLFANFAYEDWALLSLRFELHLLVHAFRKDMNDPERTGFHESHVGFYYNKYFHKQWTTKTYGCSAFKDVVDLIKENIALSKVGILEALLGEDAPTKSFVHLVEEHRRDRQRRVDAGVESAELKFQRQPQAPQGTPSQHSAQGQKRLQPTPPPHAPWAANKQARISPYQAKNQGGGKGSFR